MGKIFGIKMYSTGWALKKPIFYNNQTIITKKTVVYMSDAIKHECGIAFEVAPTIRVLQPKIRHTTAMVLTKMCLLMEKQHNRGQDGAACERP